MTDFSPGEIIRYERDHCIVGRAVAKRSIAIALRNPMAKGARSMALSVYAFRPISATDLPQVQRWLKAPHVAEWWGDPDEQFILVSGDLDHPAMDQYVVTTDNRPFAYLQCYDPTAWSNNGLGEHPDGTRGIDQFIGEPDMIDRGHGSALIGAFVDHLLNAGTPRVVTDPDPANVRAVRAYEKAGFRKVSLVDTPDGRALLMVRNA